MISGNQIILSHVHFHVRLSQPLTRSVPTNHSRTLVMILIKGKVQLHLKSTCVNITKIHVVLLTSLLEELNFSVNRGKPPNHNHHQMLIIPLVLLPLPLSCLPGLYSLVNLPPCQQSLTHPSQIHVVLLTSLLEELNFSVNRQNNQVHRWYRCVYLVYCTS